MRKAIFFRMSSFNCLYCGDMRPSAGWRAKNHRHLDHCEMLLVRQGAMEDVISGMKFNAGAGNVLFYPAGAWHTEKNAGSGPLDIIFWGWTRDKGERGTPAMVFDRNNRIRFLAQWLKEEDDKAMKDMLVRAVLHEFGRLLKPTEPAFVQAAKRLVETRLSEKIGAKEMAGTAGLSLGHFSHAFKKETGLAPGEYVRRRKMEHVRSLILSTPMPLKTIAMQVGYADEYVLFKTFKRVMGITPGSLRKQR